MRPAELLIRAVAASTNGCPSLMLRVHHQCRGTRTRLLGRAGGPFGDVVGDGDGWTMAAFDAREVADWLHSRGLAWSGGHPDGTPYVEDEAGILPFVVEVLAEGGGA